MRTVTFQSVYEAILRRHGLDPLGDAVTQDTARAITEHITDRAATAWSSWDWPELTLTEQRAYRPPWNSTTQYSRAGDNGLPDEVYYIVDQQYYRVRATAPTEPPFGHPPLAPYWDVFTPATFVARDQAGMRPMGDVLGVYKSDPSLNGCHPSDLCLKFMPSEQGVTVCCGPAGTVFIQYRLPESVYTMKPWIASRHYVSGESVFWTGDGNCYTSLADNFNQAPGNTSFWALEFVPAIFAPYLKAGAYADCLRETLTSGEEQLRLARAQLADAEADGNLEQAIDQLQAQGQVSYYSIFDRSRGGCSGCVCVTRPWTGNIVYVFTAPVVTFGPPVTAKPNMIYLPQIVSVT